MPTFYTTIYPECVKGYMPATPVLLPASAWSRLGMKAPKLPAHIEHAAADCGGFVATMRWGDYRYTPAEYVAWLRSWPIVPRWAATMDYCCEPEVLGKTDGVIANRQRRTTEMAHHFWSEYKRESWVWVPTVQGWEVADYVRHVRELRSLIEDMADYYGPGSEFRVGIGTLCRRASTEMIRAVSYAVASEIPGIPLHLWGIKLGALRSSISLPATVASVDSGAWNGTTAARDRRRWETYRDRGWKQQEYAWQVAWPEYRAKLDAAFEQPKQLMLIA